MSWMKLWSQNPNVSLSYLQFKYAYLNKTCHSGSRHPGQLETFTSSLLSANRFVLLPSVCLLVALTLRIMTPSQQINRLSRKIEQLKTKLSITEQASSTAYNSWVESTKTLLEKQISWNEKRKELEETIQQKEEKLEEKQEEIRTLQKKLDRLELWSNMEMPAPVCHICDFEYDKAKVPKVLNCGHTVCIECINRLVDGWAGWPLRCPFCRIVTASERELSTNFTLVEIIEAQKPKLSTQLLNSLSFFAVFAHDVFVSIVVPVGICYLALKK